MFQSLYFKVDMLTFFLLFLRNISADWDESTFDTFWIYQRLNKGNSDSVDSPLFGWVLFPDLCTYSIKDMPVKLGKLFLKLKCLQKCVHQIKLAGRFIQRTMWNC